MYHERTGHTTGFGYYQAIGLPDFDFSGYFPLDAGHS
tara:strand:+ start:1106 stop:1216 length:111 start_codon:yes stop_codon:yes gene_type:complete